MGIIVVEQYSGEKFNILKTNKRTQNDTRFLCTLINSMENIQSLLRTWNILRANCTALMQFDNQSKISIIVPVLTCAILWGYLVSSEIPLRKLVYCMTNAFIKTMCLPILSVQCFLGYNILSPTYVGFLTLQIWFIAICFVFLRNKIFLKNSKPWKRLRRIQ